MSATPTVSPSFQIFVTQTPSFSRVWLEAVEKLAQVSPLDPKTKAARAAGATKKEVAGAILIGLPALGNSVVEALPAALAVFEEPTA